MLPTRLIHRRHHLTVACTAHRPHARRSRDHGNVPRRRALNRTVEVSDKLLAQAKEKLSANATRIELEQAWLREFAPPPNSYNLVWAQWVLGHLTDTDVVGLLHRCRLALRPDGVVAVKDNTAMPKECDQCGNRYLLDTENAAVIRTHNHMRHLYKLAGLKLVRSEVQTGFPEDLHPVRMYWLVPAESASGGAEEPELGSEEFTAV